MRRFNKFTAMQGCVCGRVSSRERSLDLHSGDSERPPLVVLMTHPRISLVVFQYPSLASSFLRLVESFISPGTEGKTSLRAGRVSYDTLCCWVAPP